MDTTTGQCCQRSKYYIDTNAKRYSVIKQYGKKPARLYFLCVLVWRSSYVISFVKCTRRDQSVGRTRLGLSAGGFLRLGDDRWGPRSVRSTIPILLLIVINMFYRREKKLHFTGQKSRRKEAKRYANIYAAQPSERESTHRPAPGTPAPRAATPTTHLPMV